MTNLKGTATPTRHLTSEGVPEVHHISWDPLHYSMASAAAIQRISERKMILAIDPGNKPVTEQRTADTENRLVDTAGEEEGRKN